MTGRFAFAALPFGFCLLVVGTAPAAPPVVGGPTIVTAHLGTATSATTEPTANGACAEGMVEVEGEYCAEVLQVCAKWAGKDGEKRDRCAQFRKSARCVGGPGSVSKKHFCIDKFEFPNRPGEKPVVAVNFEEARDQCKAVGKRLCGSEEWTVACEGPQHLPYPTGFSRDTNACNMDRPYIEPNNSAFVNPKTRDAELARVDQRDPSGAREACVSPHGVFDMAGNVDEWVVNEHGSARKAPYDSGLKGGYWGPVRNRCRPMTTDHNRTHFGYQIGFRCCSDPK